ncbi:hypothetical protein [Amycolatopsis decaplanina]|uniref:hypothetical protein n=1 Tax=Amycolatopsis decaplanina TaxID=208441 RepID=UPI001267DFC3|nr:hypothetical protein [Amycolatopsis decaplanina]
MPVPDTWPPVVPVAGCAELEDIGPPVVEEAGLPTVPVTGCPDETTPPAVSPASGAVVVGLVVNSWPTGLPPLPVTGCCTTPARPSVIAWVSEICVFPVWVPEVCVLPVPVTGPGAPTVPVLSLGPPSDSVTGTTGTATSPAPCGITSFG